MIDILYIILEVCASIVALGATFLFTAFVARLFIIYTLPLLLEVYGRIRYPDKFQD